MKALGGNGGLKSDFFFAGTKAHDKDDRINYNKANGGRPITTATAPAATPRPSSPRS
jgi:hypothetical protein